MISDVLSDAVSDIDEYLVGDMGDMYEGESRKRIVAVRGVMDALRAELDDASGTARPIVDLVVAAAAVEIDVVRRLHEFDCEETPTA